MRGDILAIEARTQDGKQVTGDIELPSHRETFYKLMNIERYQEFLPVAKNVALEYLDSAHKYQQTSECRRLLKPFDYSRVAFKERMEAIYKDMTEQVELYDPRTDATFHNADDVKMRIRQMSPFNQNDGAWLRKIVDCTPSNKVQTNLYAILIDSIGNGRVEFNHANIYTNLMNQVGFYPKDIQSKEYAYDTELVDEAFTTPAFELSLGQFPRTFYPELLGVTLWMAWGAIEANCTVKLLKHYGFDASYYILHTGLSTNAAGHGHKAYEAIDLFMEDVIKNGGDKIAIFNRIWDGYVAMETCGNLAQKLREMTAIEGSAAQEARIPIQDPSRNEDHPLAERLCLCSQQEHFVGRSIQGQGTVH